MHPATNDLQHRTSFDLVEALENRTQHDEARDELLLAERPVERRQFDQRVACHNGIL